MIIIGRRNDDPVTADFFGFLSQENGFGRKAAPNPRCNLDTAFILIDHNFHHPHLFLPTHVNELSYRAYGKQAVNPSFDLKINDSSQFTLIYRTILVKWCQHRYVDALGFKHNLPSQYVDR